MLILHLADLSFLRVNYPEPSWFLNHIERCCRPCGVDLGGHAVLNPKGLGRHAKSACQQQSWFSQRALSHHLPRVLTLLNIIIVLFLIIFFMCCVCVCLCVFVCACVCLREHVCACVFCVCPCLSGSVYVFVFPCCYCLSSVCNCILVLVQVMSTTM